MIIKGLEFTIGDAYVIKKLHPSIILILAIFFDAISSCCSHCCWLSGPCFHYWSCHIPIIKASVACRSIIKWPQSSYVFMRVSYYLRYQQPVAYCICITSHVMWVVQHLLIYSIHHSNLSKDLQMTRFRNSQLAFGQLISWPLGYVCTICRLRILYLFQAHLYVGGGKSIQGNRVTLRKKKGFLVHALKNMYFVVGKYM